MTARWMTVWLILAAGLPAGCAGRADPEVEQAARASAEAWLAQVDAGDYEGSWAEAASYFRQAVSAERWAEMARAAREPLGALASREFTGSRYAVTLPGAPDGEYVILQYRSRFEKKQKAVETVTPTKDRDGAWRVSGYYIR